LVSAEAALRPAVDLLLGQVIVVGDRKAARSALRGMENHVRAVTLAGEIYYGSGAILVDPGKHAAALSRPRERKSLAEKIASRKLELRDTREKIEEVKAQEAEVSASLEEKNAEVASAAQKLSSSEERYRHANNDLEQAAAQANWFKRQLESLRTELSESQQALGAMGVRQEEAESNLEAARTSLKSEIEALESVIADEQVSQVSYWEAQVAIGQQALEDAGQVYQERKQSLSGLAARLEEQIARAGKVKAELVSLDYRVEEMKNSEGGIGKEIQELSALIEPAEAELAELEALQADELSQESSARQKTSLAERRYNQAQIILARRQEGLDTLRQRIEADFGLVEFEYTSDVPGPTPLPFGNALQQLPHVEEIDDDLEDVLKQKRLQIRRLGAVNPDAQQEYREVSERHEFLTEQVKDLSMPRLISAR
jgi:chromosome segregation protein